MSRISFAMEDLQAFVAIAEKEASVWPPKHFTSRSPRSAGGSRKLEKSPGSRVLDRTTRRMETTNIGRQFLEEARAVLDILVKRYSGSVTRPHFNAGTYFGLKFNLSRQRVRGY